MIAIKVEDLCVYVGQKPILGPISFQIKKGATLTIMGETGAGKSLVIQAILGTLPPALQAKGKIYLNEKRIDTLSIKERSALWGRSIATLPQEPWLALDPLMKSFKQVFETHYYVEGISTAQAQQKSSKSLLSLGLATQEPRLPGELSGGMAQRVAFAASIAGQAPVFLADEPTKGLDFERQTKVIKMLEKVPQNGGTLLSITHERAVAQSFSGELIVLRDGKVVERGQTQEVLNLPKEDYTKQLFNADPKLWPVKPPSLVSDNILLEATDLTIKRGNRLLFENLNIRIYENQRIAICGPSGIGKTSLIDTLAGLILPFSGEVKRHKKLSKFAIQKLYQDPPASFPPFVSIGTTLRDIVKIHRFQWPNVIDYMMELGLPLPLLERLPDAVSGGELQRLAIVRALITSPKILLADEMTNRLDPITQKQTLDLIDSISREKSISVIIVTHNADIAAKWADNVIDLKANAISN